MLKRVVSMTGLVAVLILAFSLAACSKKTDAQAEKAAPPPPVEQAVPAAVPAPDSTAADSTAAKAADVAAVHDCAGGCGMTAVPEAQMTAIDGKWYCAGCAKGMQQGAHHPG